MGHIFYLKFIALPNGMSGGKCSGSILVVPSFVKVAWLPDGTGTLADFSGTGDAFPKLYDLLSFRLEIEGGAAYTSDAPEGDSSKLVLGAAPAGATDLWQTVFASSRRIDGYAPPTTIAPPKQFDSATLHKTAIDYYLGIPQTPNPVAPDKTALGKGQDFVDAIMQNDASTPDISQRPLTFAEMHKAISQYPRLLRALGLVRDFTFAFPAGTLATARVRIVPVLNAGATRPDNLLLLSPWTSTVFSDGGVSAFVTDASTTNLTPGSPPLVVGRHLNLRDSRFSTLTIDPLLESLKVLNNVNNPIVVPNVVATGVASYQIDKFALSWANEFAVNIGATRATIVAGTTVTVAARSMSAIWAVLTDSGTVTVEATAIDQSPGAAAQLRLAIVAAGDAGIYEPVQLQAPIGIDDPVTASERMAPLKTADLSIAQTGAADALHDRMIDHAAKENGVITARLTDQPTYAKAIVGNADVQTDLTFDIADLQRGLVVDVRDTSDGKSWQSLCRRSVSYTFPGANAAAQAALPPGDPQELGCVTTTGLHVNSDNNPTNADLALAIHEVLFAWKNGFSCVVPPPGTDGSNARRLVAEPGPDGFSVTFDVPNDSLPPLRYGRSFRFSARIMDLAGNVPQLDPALAEMSASSDVAFLRYEPILPPAIIYVDDQTLNRQESLATVIAADTSPHSPWGGNRQRHLAPPKADFTTMLRHRVFDNESFTGWRDELSPGGNVDDTYQWVVDSNAGAVNAIPSVHSAPTFDIRTFANGVNGINGAIPDPLADHYCIFGLPNHKDGLAIPLYLSEGAAVGDPGYAWPHPMPVVLEVREGVPTESGLQRFLNQPGIDDHWLLTVYLQKGTELPIEICSAPRREQIDSLALYEHIMKSSTDEKTKQSLADDIVNGASWLFTPRIRLRLIHALSQPQFAPATTAKDDQLRTDESVAALAAETLSADQARIAVKGAPNSSKAQFSFTRYLPYRSASAFTAKAAWDEWRDDGPGRTPPSKQPFSVELYREDLPLAADGWRSVSFGHTFDDPRHRALDVGLQVTARYASVFVNPINGFTTQTPAGAPENQAAFLNAAVPKPLTTSYANPILQWEFVPASGDQWTIAREEMANDNHYYWKRTRRAGVRIRVARPCLQTGLHEELGIVTCSDLTQLEAMRGHVTEIGRNPIWQTSRPDYSTILRDYVDSEPLTLAIGGQPHPIVVYGYPLRYQDAPDDDYCADVFFAEPISYMPLVRLVATRYQPDSLPSCKISVASATPFVPILPTRTMTVRWTQQNRWEMKIDAPVMPSPPGIFQASVYQPLASGSDPSMFVPIATIPTTVLTPGQFVDLQIDPHQRFPIYVRVDEFETHETDGNPSARRVVYSDGMVLIDQIPLESLQLVGQ